MRGLHIPSFLAGRSRTLANVGVLSIASVAIVVAAATSDGYKATNVDLDDGAVWVTDASNNKMGRLVVEIDQVDVVRPTNPGPDVIQDGRRVIAGDALGTRWIAVETATPSKVVSPAPLGSVRMGDDTLVVHERETGNLWTGRAAGVLAPEYPRGAVGRVGEGSLVEVTASGRVIVIDPSVPDWYEIELDSARRPIVPVEETTSTAVGTTTTSTTTPLVDGEAADEEPPKIEPTSRTPIPRDIPEGTVTTVVGEQVVMLTPDGQVIALDGRSVSVPGTGWRLQQRSPLPGEVLVATNEGLYSVDFDGEARVVATGQPGLPAAPVRVASCIYSAWASTSADAPTFLRQCGDADPTNGSIEDGDPGSLLEFRVNRNNIALNAVEEGRVWAIHDGRLVDIGDWGDQRGENSEVDSPDEPSANDESNDERCDRADPNIAPQAINDPELGARSNVQSMLDVLANDTDGDCDPISISSELEFDDAYGSFTVVDNGQRLLYTPNDAARALKSPTPVPVTYRVRDARNEPSVESAVATVLLAPPATDDDVSSNRAPGVRSDGAGKKRPQLITVESGEEITFDVLADWFDPDGDEITLVSASVTPGAGEVTFSPLGRVRYNVPNVQPGTYDIEIAVSDGRKTTSGVVEATVQAQGTELDPRATNDFATLAIGDSVVIRPTANDTDPNGVGDELSANFGDTARYRDLGLDVVYRPGSDELIIRALTTDEGTVATPGVLPIAYSITDTSLRDAAAVVQVTVLAPVQGNAIPVAVPDRVVMRPGRVVNVDVLDNDVDLNGDLLAILSATTEQITPERGGVRAAVVDRRFLQVELVRPADGTPMSGAFVVGYAITDGSSGTTVPGQLVVLVDATANDQPPTGVDDEIVVRQGQVMSVDALVNDVDPDGDQITLVGTNPQQTATRAADGEFLAWAHDGEVFVRGGKPGTYEIAYDIEANNRQGAGLVKVRVLAAPSEGSPNLPPAPRTIEVRVARGKQVRIPVPLEGIDPDGDEVELASVLPTTDPASSVATKSPDESDVILYEVDARSSFVSDTFQYEVRDMGPGGTTVAGVVEVVVVDVDFSPPVAHDDIVRARPGRELVIPVLANDVDADDDQLELADPAFLDANGVASELPLNPDRVEKFADKDNLVLRGGALKVTVPSEGTVAERYVITDGRSTSWAYVQVVSDPTAPNIPPVTEGKRIEADEVKGLAVGAVLPVDVELISYDPDGPKSQLTFSVPDGQPGVVAVARGGFVDVTLTAAEQFVVYAVSDGDAAGEATTYGVLRVPGLETNEPPRLRDPLPEWEISVADATTLTFDLAEIVVDPDGDTVQLSGKDVVAPSPLTAKRSDDNRSFTVAIGGEVLADQVLPVSIEVEDRPGDPLNLTVTLIVKVRVIPEDVNNPPILLTDGQLSVPLFDEPQQIDLRSLVDDDEGDDIEFANIEAPPGIEVSPNGSVLTVTGKNPTAALGSAGSINFTFTDNQKDHEPLTGSVAITITQTNKASPVAANLGPFDALVNRAAAGVDVIAAATNLGGFELGIASVTSSTGSLNCSANCGTAPIVFTPTGPGTFTVEYTLTEEISQPRSTSGSITYVVKGEPLAPGTPSVVSVGDERVSLSWTTADMQGGTLVEYVVRAVESGDTQTTTSTSHEFTGLTNNQTYHFEVFAVNEVGDGVVSGQSSGARPDTVPEPPVAPRFTSYENGALNLAWTAPPSAGSTRYSPIIEYQIDLNGYGQIIVSAASLTLRQAGLANGTDYTFRVRARNTADVNGGWGEWSTTSSPERPSTNPSQVASVTVTPSGDGGQSRASITWPAPADGGRPILRYNVCSVPATLGCQQADLTRTQQFIVPTGSTFTFTVQAVNSDVNTPNGPVSAPSSSFQGIVLPGAPSNLQVTSGDRTLTATATAGSNGGCSTTAIEYTINGATWQLSGTFTNLTNGTLYTVQARMRTGVACQTYLTAANRTAPWSSSISAPQTPYGPLVQPSISASVSGPNITYTWNASQGSNGRPWTGQIIGEGCDRTINAGSAANSCVTTPGYNSGTRTVVVRVTDTRTGEQLSAQAQAATGAPPFSVSISRSGSWINGSVANGTPGAQYWISCREAGGEFVNTQTGRTVDNFGNVVFVSFSNRFLDGAGNGSWGNNVCFNSAATYVYVWTSAGQSFTTGSV